MKKQVLLLSALVWGLVLFAPFPGNPGFSLAPSFDTGGPVRTGPTSEVERTLPFAARSILPVGIEPPSSAPGAERTASNSSINQPADVKQTDTPGQLSYLSPQNCQQQLTHPSIQNYFIQHELLDIGVTQSDGTASHLSNREPILISHNGDNGGSWRTPRSLPSVGGDEEGKQNEPEPVTWSRLHPEDSTPDRVNSNRLCPPGPSAAPGENPLHLSYTR